MFVCLLNPQMQIKVNEINDRLKTIGPVARNSLVTLANRLRVSLCNISPTGLLPYLSDQKILMIVNLINSDTMFEREGLIYLGLQ